MLSLRLHNGSGQRPRTSFFRRKFAKCVIMKVLTSFLASKWSDFDARIQKKQKDGRQGSPSCQLLVRVLFEHNVLRGEQTNHLREEELRATREQAVYYLIDSALAGNGDAQCVVGLMFEEGLGVRKVVPNAIFFYKMGSDAGHSTAECIMVNLISLA